MSVFRRIFPPPRLKTPHCAWCPWATGQRVGRNMTVYENQQQKLLIILACSSKSPSPAWT